MRQRPLRRRAAVLLPFRAFQRDLPIFGPKAGWIDRGIKSFQSMPLRHQGEAIPASRLIAVLQGWDVAGKEIAAQIRVAGKSGTSGYIVSHLKIDQSWQPRVVKWKLWLPGRVVAGETFAAHSYSCSSEMLT